MEKFQGAGTGGRVLSLSRQMSMTYSYSYIVITYSMSVVLCMLYSSIYVLVLNMPYYIDQNRLLCLVHKSGRTELTMKPPYFNRPYYCMSHVKWSGYGIL